ncbi:MAG: hypothetical protein ABI091_03310 [Ferruginibacter sp.]
MQTEFDLLDALNSPYITFDSSWASCIPQRIKGLIIPARLVLLKKGFKMCCLPEVVFYLTTRSFTAPMSNEWTEIFTHVSCKVLDKYFNEDHYKEIDAPRELGRYLTDDLTSLRIKIYEKRREELRNKLKTSKKAA